MTTSIHSPYCQNLKRKIPEHQRKWFWNKYIIDIYLDYFQRSDFCPRLCWRLWDKLEDWPVLPKTSNLQVFLGWCQTLLDLLWIANVLHSYDSSQSLHSSALIHLISNLLDVILLFSISKVERIECSKIGFITLPLLDKIRLDPFVYCTHYVK